MSRGVVSALLTVNEPVPAENVAEVGCRCPASLMRAIRFHAASVDRMYPANDLAERTGFGDSPRLAGVPSDNSISKIGECSERLPYRATELSRIYVRRLRGTRKLAGFPSDGDRISFFPHREIEARAFVYPHNPRSARFRAVPSILFRSIDGNLVSETPKIISKRPLHSTKGILEVKPLPLSDNCTCQQSDEEIFTF